MSGGSVVPAPDSRGVEAGRLTAFVRTAGRQAGLGEEDADFLGDGLVNAEMRGVSSHGVARLPAYIRGFAAGHLNPRPTLAIVRERAAAVTLDGDNGLGLVVGQRAMDIAVEKAKACGVGVVAVRNSNHSGMLAQHALRAAEQKAVGYFTSNGPALMALWGGRTPVVSNNPFAYAVPRSSGPPIVLDMACSAAARGRIRLAAGRGEPIPAGWALDADGVPTTDARSAMAGTVLPFGQHKGSGLAVINELLAAALPGAALSVSVSRAFLEEGATTLDSWGIGHLAIALDVAAFDDPEAYGRRVEQFVERAHSSGDDVLLPGELEHRRREECLAVGIPLAATTRRELRRLADEIGVEGDLVA